MWNNSSRHFDQPRRPLLAASALSAFLCATLLGATGCASDCAGVGLSRVLPADITIAVGQGYFVKYQTGGTCEPYRPPQDENYKDTAAIWYTPDTLVVRVDSTTGLVTGRAIGDAKVVIRSAGLTVLVHVR